MNIFEKIICPICNQRDYKILKKQKFKSNNNVDFENIFKSATKFKLIEQVVKCKNCSLVYLNPRIKENFIIKGYKDSIDIDHSSQDKYRVKTFDKFLDNFEKIYYKKLNEFDNFNALDIGTASGSFLKSLKKKNWDGIGIEPNKKLSTEGSKKYGVKILNEHIIYHLQMVKPKDLPKK